MAQHSTGALTYKQLDAASSEIRLLTVQNAAFDEPIQCSLDHAGLESNLEYEALSYVWGDENNVLPIQVNGATTQVTVNLEAALRQLRSADTPRVLWVDALCINQDDNVEKSRQVPRMTDIYRKARKVLVWLGKDDDDAQEGDLDEENKNTRASARAAFTFVAWAAMFAAGHRNISYKIDELFMNEEDRSAYIRLAQLVQRRWFERMWVLQEIAVAGDVDIICGNATMPWDRLLKISDIFKRVEDISPMTEHLYVTPFQGLREIELCRSERMLFDIPDFESRTQYSVVPLTGALFHLVGKKKMKDIRDRLYAILGLYGDKETWARDPRLCPDYNKSAAEVFTGLARYFIEDHGLLDILAAYHEEIDNIPSWVPTWSKTVTCCHLHSYITTKPSVKNRTGSAFSPEFSSDGTVLTMKGRLVCWIDFPGNPNNDPEPSPDTDLYEGWSAYMKLLLRRWEAEITSCPLLQRNYRKGSWKADIARDFYNVLLHGMNEEHTLENYHFLMDDSLYNATIEHISKDQPEDVKEYSLKMLSYNLNRWAKGVFHQIGSEIPFVTRKGMMGLTANGCRPQPGDVICLFYGASVPFILRERDDFYQFVGPCYLESWMDTKMVQQTIEILVDNGLPLTEFRLK